MAFTVSNGSVTLGEQFSKEGKAIDVAYILKEGNSVVVQQEDMVNRFFDKFIKTIEAVPGQRVPVETWNLMFSPAGLTSDAPEFTVNRKHFNLKKESFKILGFSHTFDDVMSDMAVGGSLLARDMERMNMAKDLYMYTYLPAVKIQTFISGDSTSTTLPVANVGGAYTSQLGVLRGEDCSDILYPYVTEKNVNMLRCKKQSTLSSNDIFAVTKLLKGFKTNNGARIWGIGSDESIWELKNVLAYGQNIDKFIVDGVPFEKIASVNFTTLNGLPDGFLFFIVEKAGEYPIVKAVEKDPAQQGLVIISKKGLSVINDANDTDGAYLQISKEGYHLLRRESIGVLSLKTAHSSGEMQTADIEALETFLSTVRDGIVMEY